MLPSIPPGSPFSIPDFSKKLDASKGSPKRTASASLAKAAGWRQGLIAYFDADAIPDAAGASIAVWHDLSGNGAHVRQATVANQPVVAVDAYGKYLDLSTGRYLARTSWLGTDFLTGTAGVARPYTTTVVFKANSGAATGTRVIVKGNTSTEADIALQSGVQAVIVMGGGTGMSGGKRVDDDQWHIASAVNGLGTDSALFIDNYLESASATAGGSNSLQGLSIGASSIGGVTLKGCIAAVLIHNRALSAKEISEIHQTFGGARGIAVAADADWPQLQDSTSSNGQAIRYWEPQTLKAGAPVVVLCHRYTGNQQISATAAPNLFKMAMALTSAGYRVVASNQHGNNWGNAASVDDIVDAVAFMATRQAVTKVIVIAESMGGLSTLLSVPTSGLPIVGVVTSDPVTNLFDAYDPQSGFATYRTSIDSAHSIVAGTLSASSIVGATSVSSSVSFPSGTTIKLGLGATAENVTTTGAPTGAGPYTIPVPALTKAHASGEIITDYPTKTAGRDPNLRAASDFTGVRWLMFNSVADVASVNAANNTTAFAAKIAAAPEVVVVDSIGGAHLGGVSLAARLATETIRRWCAF